MEQKFYYLWGRVVNNLGGWVGWGGVVTFSSDVSFFFCGGVVVMNCGAGGGGGVINYEIGEIGICHVVHGANSVRFRTCSVRHETGGRKNTHTDTHTHARARARARTHTRTHAHTHIRARTHTFENGVKPGPCFLTLTTPVLWRRRKIGTHRLIDDWF